MSDNKLYPLLERGILEIYIAQIKNIPVLSQEEETKLVKLMKSGNQKARAQLILSNLRLVVKIAYYYNFCAQSLPDLISEGNIGLIKGIDQFDPEKGARLCTYAGLWVKQYIRQHLASQTKTFRIPLYLIEKISEMHDISDSLFEKLGREPTNKEIGDAMNISIEKIAYLKQIANPMQSLDKTIDANNQNTLESVLSDEKSISPSDLLEYKSDVKKLIAGIEQLSPRSSEILSMRFGLNSSPHTLSKIGEKFHLTKERIRQIQDSAIKELKKLLTTS